MTLLEQEEKSLTQVRKRDGRVVTFDQNKIVEAIWKAAQAVGGRDRDLSKGLGVKAINIINERFAGRTPTVEEIQDIVEKVLVENGHYTTAKAYILYREQRRLMRDAKQALLSVSDIVESYISQEDWRVNENANIGYSFSGLLWHCNGAVMSYYTLNYVYPRELAQPHIGGDYHLHNINMGVVGYCAGWSLAKLLTEGFNGVSGKVESSPPKHLRSAVSQMVNFLGTLQNEWAGAQAFSSFDTYLAPFVRADNLSFRQVKQCMQEFVFGVNISSRWGGQTPFSNITLDLHPPDDLENMPVIVDGKTCKDSTYADYQPEMNMINKALFQVLTEGDMNHRVFTFPIPTINITKDFDWDSEISDLIFDVTARYGLPYLQNFVSSDLNPSDVRAMCCRLQLNLKELQKKTGGYFGFGEATGSVGVVTINLPRIGFLARDETDFFERLERMMYLAMRSLEIKRKIVLRNLEHSLLPYTSRYLGTFKNHFSTIGIVGMNEACLNFLGKSIAENEGRDFALKVLDFMREKLVEYQAMTGNLYNLEATPSEGTSYRLAKVDKQKYPNIVTAGEEVPYYTNSTHLPVNYTDDLWWALRHQEPLQRKYTGGTVLHLFLDESLNSQVESKTLVRKVVENYGIPYFTITPTFSICINHGYLRGKHFTCPECGKPAEVFSRVVGYYRPVQQWNLGKKEEFRQRKSYSVNGIV